MSIDDTGLGTRYRSFSGSRRPASTVHGDGTARLALAVEIGLDGSEGCKPPGPEPVRAERKGRLSVSFLDELWSVLNDRLIEEVTYRVRFQILVGDLIEH